MRKFALLVGIDEYPSGPLSYCVNDATEMTAILQQEEYKFQTLTLLNDEATQSQIHEHLELLLNARPSVFLFYFSGHGCSTELRTSLVTFDGIAYNEGIDVAILARWFDRFAQVGSQVVAILDCCHSGAASPWPGQARPIAPDELEHGIGALGQSKIVMAACRPEQWTLEEGDKQHGIFTYYLLEGLLGGAADHAGKIDAFSLYKYAHTRAVGTLNPEPMIRGEATGPLLLGEGFPPTSASPIDVDTRSHLESKAQQHINSIAAIHSSGIEQWKLQGYSDACRSIEPVARWFDNQLRRHPNLRSRVFDDCLTSLKARIAQMGHIDPGTHFADGILERPLGEGTFGRVWLMRERKDATTRFAYKVYHPQDIYNHDKIYRFERGYRAMKQLDHPSIVSVTHFTSCPIGFFMEFIDGPNLRDAGSVGDSFDIIKLMADVAQAVSYAHAKAVVHRDIKPENIILSYSQAEGTWHPHLTDFDLAWFATATTFTKDKEAFGTLHYAAPEQLERPKSNSAHAKTVDVYSFGQLLLFIISGRDPFLRNEEANEDILRRKLSDWPSTKAARKMMELYQDCTKVRVSERLPSLEDIRDVLLEVGEMLAGTDPDARVDLREFLTEIAHRMARYQTVTEGEGWCTFQSGTGRTQISLTVREQGVGKHYERLSIEANLVPMVRPVVGGAVDFESARRTMNRRIDSALQRHRHFATRRSGQQGSYEAFIDFKDLPMRLAGVIAVREALDGAVGAIEKA